MSLRILHVVESLAPEAGSIAVSVTGLVHALNQRDLPSSLVALEGKQDGTNPVAVGAGASPESADLVHVHGWHMSHAAKIGRILRDVARPFVLSPLGGLIEGAYNKRKWWESLRFALRDARSIRRAACLAAMGPVEQEELEARSLNKSVALLPYGLCLEEYDSEVQPRITALPRPEDRVLLVLGPIHPAEGLVQLLNAFAEVGEAADGWAIAMAGPEVGDWRRALEAAIRRKGGAGRARFVSAPDVASQREWLARAALLMAPSLHPRCPISIMQAAVSGVPVIASDRIAPPGLNGAIDIYAPSRGGLKQALRTALEQTDEQRKEMGRRARELGRALFDWNRLVDRYAQLYRDVASRD